MKVSVCSLFLPVPNPAAPSTIGAPTVMATAPPTPTAPPTNTSFTVGIFGRQDIDITRPILQSKLTVMLLRYYLNILGDRTSLNYKKVNKDLPKCVSKTVTLCTSTQLTITCRL